MRSMENKKKGTFESLFLMAWAKLMALNTGKMKLQTQHTMIVLFAEVLVAALAFTALVVFYVVPQLSVTGVAAKGTVLSSGNTCIGAGYSPIVNYKGALNDPTNGLQPTQFAIAVNVFLANSTAGTPVATITTVATGVANAGSGNVPCTNPPTGVWAYWGDNTNFYIQPWPGQSNPYPITQSITTFLNPGIEKMSNLVAASGLFGNGITFSNLNVIVYGTVAGAAIPTGTVQLKGGLYAYGAEIPGDYPSGTFCVAIGSNTVAFRNIGAKIGAVSGRLTTQTCQPTTANSYTNEGYTSFEFPSSLVNASATPTLTISGTATSSYAVADTQLGANYPLNIYINDKVLQATGSILTPTYLNINTGADLGQAATAYVGNVVLG